MDHVFSNEENKMCSLLGGLYMVSQIDCRYK